MGVERLEPFKFAVKILRFFGIWKSSDLSKCHLIYRIAIHLFLIELCLSLQIVYLFTFETLQDFSNLMSLLPTFVGIFFKSLNITFNHSQIQELLGKTEKLLENCEDGMKVKKRLVIVEKIFKTLLSFAIFNCVTGAISTIHELP